MKFTLVFLEIGIRSTHSLSEICSLADSINPSEIELKYFCSNQRWYSLPSDMKYCNLIGE